MYPMKHKSPSRPGAPGLPRQLPESGSSFAFQKYVHKQALTQEKKKSIYVCLRPLVYSKSMFLEENTDPQLCLRLRPPLGCPPLQSPYSDGTGLLCGPHSELFSASGSFFLYPAASTPRMPLEKSP